MMRPGLLCLLLIAAGACKSKEAAKPAVEAKKAPLVTTTTPVDVVYAASAHVRVADARSAKVIKEIDLQKAVRKIVFSADGQRAYVAASDGVREIDARTHTEVAHLTKKPARDVFVSEDGRKVHILQHEVRPGENGTREVMPFELVTFDAATRAQVSQQEVGQRALFARPPLGDRRGLLITEMGDVHLVSPGQAFGDAEKIDVTGGIPSQVEKLGVRPRQFAILQGDRAYVPVEGAPSRILDVDLSTGEVVAINLERTMSLRGLAAVPGGTHLLVNAGMELLLVDLRTRSVSASIELEGGHVGAAVSSSGKHAYLARTIHGSGGSITVVGLDAFKPERSIGLDDISPWALAVRP